MVAKKIDPVKAARQQQRAADAEVAMAEYEAGIVPVGNSRSDILVMQPAEHRHGERLTDGLDGARDRRILLQ
jgi:hypothetical protein